jgi:hypothetical protein
VIAPVSLLSLVYGLLVVDATIAVAVGAIEVFLRLLFTSFLYLHSKYIKWYSTHYYNAVIEDRSM